ncbi:MAG TPA: deoxyribonuclease IV [Verrucomicrobiae bacterium]|jgi:deoxyribonuclease-4|nr:deoxyribonuclease IV [Verrucomicrobiae bacterium]
MIFGAHCSTAGGVWKALERAETIGAQSCQIFVKNNMQWLGRAHSDSDVAKFAAARKRLKLAAVFGHTGYLINLGAPPSANRDKSLQSLQQEIEFATALELPFLVMHPGAHLGAGEEVGIKRIVEGLNEIFRATSSSPVRIALENTAGQGSCLGHRVEHLAAIYDAVQSPERLALCIDTAHLFASGYDVREPGGWQGAIDLIDKLIGRKEIAAFHLNDSKTDFGSRVDRHDHIGKGKIGREAFRYLLNDARFKNTPGCLETFKSDDLHEDVENLATLRSLSARRTAPRKGA